MNFQIENFADLYMFSGTDISVFNDNISNNFTNIMSTKPLPNIKKDDYIDNFWRDLPNLDAMESEINPINTEIEIFLENKDKISELSYLFVLKNKLYTLLNNLENNVKEKNKERDEITSTCNKLQDQLYVLKTKYVLLTPNTQDIEYNKVWKEDIQKFENKIKDYNSYVTSSIDTYISKIRYTVQKYQVIYDKITEIVNSINKSIFDTYYKDKMPNSTIYCSICLTNASSHVCVPCGHIFCKSCCDKINNKCATCRENVEKVVKLYNLDEIKESQE
jgi:hypothetical protein